jgi:hypothetical protein
LIIASMRRLDMSSRLKALRSLNFMVLNRYSIRIQYFDVFFSPSLFQYLNIPNMNSLTLTWIQ